MRSTGLFTSKTVVNELFVMGSLLPAWTITVRGDAITDGSHEEENEMGISIKANDIVNAYKKAAEQGGLARNERSEGRRTVERDTYKPGVNMESREAAMQMHSDASKLAEGIRKQSQALRQALGLTDATKQLEGRLDMLEMKLRAAKFDALFYPHKGTEALEAIRNELIQLKAFADELSANSSVLH